MREKQIRFEILTANLNPGFFSNKNKAVAKFYRKLSEVQEEGGLEVCLLVTATKRAEANFLSQNNST